MDLASAMPQRQRRGGEFRVKLERNVSPGRAAPLRVVPLPDMIFASNDVGQTHIGEFKRLL